jgi:hypothetical protein
MKQSRQAEREIIVTLRLPRELHAKLRELGGERGLTREIRDRLERSFAHEPPDDNPAVREAVVAIQWVLGGYSRMKEGVEGGGTGHWYDDPKSFWVIHAAVLQILNRLRPAGADEPGDEGIGGLLGNAALLHARGLLP